MRGDYMLSAVTRAISGHFGKSLAVYKERPAQNAPKEYLFVHQLNREQTPDNAHCYNRFYFFDVRFHPNDKQSSQYQRFTEVAEGLSECLYRVVTDDTPVKATSMRSEVRDGVLHFFADYLVRVMEALPPEPIMQELQLDEKIKE